MERFQRIAPPGGSHKGNESGGDESRPSQELGYYGYLGGVHGGREGIGCYYET